MKKWRVNFIKKSLSEIRTVLGRGAGFDKICAAVWELYKVRFGDRDFDL